MLLDELFEELEEFRGKGYCICFDIDDVIGVKGFMDIKSIEIDESAGVIHLTDND